MSKIILFLSLAVASLLANAQTLDSSQISTLKDVIYKSIHNLHAPENDSDFRGSFDWHSDVHAHWALLSMARITKDADLEKKMLDILTIERLEKEYQFLTSKQYINFEKPYGRAWFLLLLWELNHRAIAKNEKFKTIRKNLTDDMIQWLSNSNFPEAGGDTLIGTHDSWLMGLFLFDTAKSQNVKTRKVVTDLVQNKMLAFADKIENHQMEDFDFLYLPALKYLLHPDHRYQNSSLPLPSTTQFACHYPGAIQVSLWAHSAQCARRDSNACAVVKNISQEFYKQTLLWKDNFDCVTHWVPQFTWMTHWLSMGKP